MHPWAEFDSIVLKPAGDVSLAFIASGIHDYRAAARFVCRLPYGRNSGLMDPLIVMRENRGTCSTKHALRRRLAKEQELDVLLVLGIYEMNGKNTPGTGPILEQFGLTYLPEAHCYLRFRGKRIDVTRDVSCAPVEPISHFLHEEIIDAEQIGEYKATLHRQFLWEWMSNGFAMGRTLDEV